MAADTAPAPYPSDPVFRSGVGALPVAVCAALAVGMASAVSTKVGIASAIVICLAVALSRHPGAILAVLMSSVFLELVNLGGITISRLVAPVGALMLLLAFARPRTEIRAAPPLFWTLLYTGWALASGFWTLSVGGTVYLLASLAIALVYMFCFASLLTTRVELDRLLVALAAVSFTIGALSIFAFTGHSVLGFGLLQEGRVQGGTGDPSFFAAAQLIALPLMLVMAAESASKLRRALVYGAALTNVASVLTTVSRGAVIQLVFIAILLLVIPSRSVFNSKGQKWLVMLVLVAGAVVFFARYSADLAPRLETIFLSESKQTGSGRKEFWAAATRSIDERPALGVGYGAWVRISNERLKETPNIDLSRWKFRPKGSEVHNAFIGTTAELGFVGLVLFVGLLGSTAVMLRRFAWRARALGQHYLARIANALLIGLLGWCVGSMFIETETSRPIWIVIGITLALPKLLDRPAAAPPEG
jgi:putative inorganic carbon (HCO3(-)) transporter